MTYEDESLAEVGITPLVMLRSNLAIGRVKTHPDKRSACRRRTSRVGRRLPLYRQLYGLSLFLGHGLDSTIASTG
jgi:hypothetical protein